MSLLLALALAGFQSPPNPWSLSTIVTPDPPDAGCEIVAVGPQEIYYISSIAADRTLWRGMIPGGYWESVELPLQGPPSWTLLDMVHLPDPGGGPGSLFIAAWVESTQHPGGVAGFLRHFLDDGETVMLPVPVNAQGKPAQYQLNAEMTAGDNRLYVAMAYVSDPVLRFHEYDVASETWRLLAGLPVPPGRPDPAALVLAHAPAERVVYALPSFGDAELPAGPGDFWRYDVDGDDWETLVAPCVVRRSAAMVVDAVGSLVLFPGFSANPSSPDFNRRSEFHRYRPATRTWARLPDSDPGLGFAPSMTIPPGQSTIYVCRGNSPVPGGNFVLQYSNIPAARPRELLQATASGEVVPPGGLVVLPTGAASVDLRISAIVSDINLDEIRLELEMKPAGTPFSPSPTPTELTSGSLTPGGTASVTFGALVPGGYHWRVRAVDDRGDASSWAVYGGGPSSTDFVLRTNQAPEGSGSGQFSGTDGSVLPAGGRVAERTPVRLGAFASDGDGDPVAIDLEVRLLGEAMTGAATATGGAGAGWIGIDEEFPKGEYVWRYRFRDPHGGASAWSGSGVEEGRPDFVVIAGGSFRSLGCGAAGGGIGVLLALLVPFIRRR